MNGVNEESIWERIGEVGIIENGPHQGKYVLIERDETDSGFHIWILAKWPGVLPNSGWDGWADDMEGVNEWLSDPDFRVSWTGRFLDNSG